MATLSDLYTHLKTLCEQWFYNKSQIDTSLAAKEDTSNKKSSWSSTTNNTNYPGEKLVKDSLDGKVDKETGKGLSSNDYTTTEKNKLAGIEAQANKTVIDSALSSTSTNPLQNKAINTALSNKADSSSVPTKTSDLTNDGADGTNVFVANNDSRLSDSRTPTSHTHGNLTNDGKVGSNANYFVYTTTGGAITSKQKIGNINTDGKIGSTANLPLITGSNGVIITGSFGTSANTFCQGNDSRLSDARTPTDHNQATTTITNNQAYNNIKSGESTTVTLTNQKLINDAINTKLGELASIGVIHIVDTLPIASESTMGKLYIVAENNKVNVYYTKPIDYNPYFIWEKMDADILDELVVRASDVTDENGHTHIGSSANANQGTINGLIDTALASKIGTSSTVGLVKNDGSIDTTSYLSSLPNHPHGNILFDGTCATNVNFNSKILVTNSANKIGTSTAIDVLDSVVQSLISYGSS